VGELKSGMPSQSAIELEDDERWQLAARVAASRHFEKASHLRQLLLFLSEKAITSPTKTISEQEIGVNALGRRPGYDPLADNIVRVQIRHLRRKLDEYFKSAGRSERMLLSIPKGPHAPRFDDRRVPQIVGKPASSATKVSVGHIGVLLLAVALLAGAFFIGRTSGMRSAGAPMLPDVTASSPLWGRLFQRDHPTTIVVADSSMVYVENILGTTLTLSGYLDGSYKQQIEAVSDPSLREALQTMASRQYTSLADATVSAKLTGLAAPSGAFVSVRYARHLNIRDFNSGNFILIGSRDSVPWVESFEPALNFRFEMIGRARSYGIRNLHPRGGEAATYTVVESESRMQESYATISMLPNLWRNGTVLILAGVTMEATESAAEFSMSEEFSQILRDKLLYGKEEQLPYFEVLLKTVSVAGGPQEVDIVAWRTARVD